MTRPAGVKLLSGGNPQIAKAYGDAPVQAWIEAAPGWKSAAAAQLDRLITAAYPGVAKAVKWNSPLYGHADGTWFLGCHAMRAYLKLGFFQGSALQPPPPVGSKQPLVRYLHIHEDQPFDAAQFTDWVTQAALLPGTKL